MNITDLNNSLKNLGKQVKDFREEKGYTLYYASSLCEMGSNSGLRRLENGDDIRLSTLLKASKNLGLEITISEGIISLK